MPVHANTYPVVNPSHSQDNHQQASHHHGINAHKIGEYANTAVRVGGTAMKMFNMLEDRRGGNGGSGSGSGGGGGDGNSGFLGGLLDGNNGDTDNSWLD